MRLHQQDGTVCIAPFERARNHSSIRFGSINCCWISGPKQCGDFGPVPDGRRTERLTLPVQLHCRVRLPQIKHRKRFESRSFFVGQSIHLLLLMISEGSIRTNHGRIIAGRWQQKSGQQLNTCRFLILRNRSLPFEELEPAGPGVWRRPARRRRRPRSLLHASVPILGCSVRKKL